MNVLRLICSLGLTPVVRGLFAPGKIFQTYFLAQLPVRNPIGLGAGFDKNARYLRELKAIGFGFVEIGTVTPLAQEGNPRPRLFRLKKDAALINRMGFNNDGADKIAKRLSEWRRIHNSHDGFLIGGNIGKNKSTPNEDAWLDYEKCFTALHDHVDYFVVNVSSPNTPGLRALQDKESLRKILLHLQKINNTQTILRPIFLKIAPDLEQSQVDDVLDLAAEINLDGLVVANTTISRNYLKTSTELVEKIGAGGLSGKPLTLRSTELLKYIVDNSSRSMPVIASGGIFNATDANEKLKAGATVVQVWTGFIYEGPAIVKQICRHINITEV